MLMILLDNETDESDESDETTKVAAV